jgi:hypothetical protein
VIIFRENFGRNNDAVVENGGNFVLREMRRVRRDERSEKETKFRTSERAATCISLIH